ncbi:unnamed protein product, partial [Aureobasidium pullulans]
DDWMGCCHLRCSELAIRDPRVRKERLDTRIHDRRHGSRISSPLHASCCSTRRRKRHRSTRRCCCSYSL